MNLRYSGLSLGSQLDFALWSEVGTPKVGQNGQLLRFLVVGTWNTLFGLALFFSLMKTGINYQLVLFCSFTIATAQSHFTQRKFVWGAANGYLHELMRFYLGIFGVYVLNALLLPLLVEGFDLDVFLSQCLLTLTLVILSFWFQKKFVFNNRNL